MLDERPNYNTIASMAQYLNVGLPEFMRFWNELSAEERMELRTTDLG